MASVDNRIVKMEFDNAEFERKISATLTSIGNLNDALKFKGATQGLSDISAAADKVNMGGIGQGIEDISKKFLALSTVAITVLANITTKAFEAGTQIVKSLTLDPILDGYREYETNLQSIQTILANTASKGTTLDDVTKALDLLNQYSDQTIYNFGQMARNIGTFTAAGVDLETSVNSIKGIANIAAMSGSSADQAAMAMYQLSQAIASGTVKLIDWNSVVNAGMGGEAFQSALFETGKALGTLKDVPMGQTFTEWKDAGNSFRDSLQDGWITADVLTTTLAGFTGDMTEEMLLAKGFSEEQALNIMKTAAVAKAAATEVKTFTQLIGTVQEAVGSGWAESFRIVIGNFTEAKALWTGVNNSISSFVQKNADARNEILQGWKDFGGRTELINTLKSAFHSLGEVLGTIKEAFSNIFPPVTAATLVRLTAGFRELVTSLIPSVETINHIRTIFEGFFSALAIGWEIIKEGSQFLIGLGKSLLGIVSPGVTGFLLKLSDGLKSLKVALVDNKGIEKFFDGLSEALQKPIKFIEAIKDALGSVFDLFDGGTAEAVGDAVGRVGDRFSGLSSIFDRLGDFWAPFQSALEKIGDILSGVWDVIANWFHELGDRMARVMKEGDFDAVLDAINTGLLGGIALLLAKFIKSGFTFDIGSGMFEKIGTAFEQLTGTLKAMQAEIKANALLKIASAIAVLTASVLVLSLIDSEALTKALVAMSVGFGQLIGAFSLLTKMVTGPKEAASFSIISAGLIALSTAILILSAAVKAFSTMDWEELAKGFVGITGGLIALGVAVRTLPNGASMAAKGAGLVLISGSLIILAAAMKLFATMSWEEMAKGMVGVGGGLVAIAIGLRLMPDGASMVLQGVGLIGVAVALVILSAAVAAFGNMDWETIGKGMVGIGGGLVIIAGAMQLMPANMPLLAAGLVLVGVALIEIAAATNIFAGMNWDEIARGLTAMAGSLLILAGAMYLMGNNLAGGAALIVAAVGLGMLGAVVKQFSKMGWDEISHGLLAMGVALASIAAAALLLQPATAAILALGAALIVLGIGFVAIGGGLYLLAEGLKTIISLGNAVTDALGDVLKGIGKAIPALLTGLAEGIVDMVQVFVEAAPVFAKAINVIVDQIVDTFVRNLPKILDAFNYIIGRLIEIGNERGPELIQLGFHLLMQLLKGIRDNIEQIVNVVAEIIRNFLDAFTKEIPSVAKSLADAIIAMFTSAAYETGRVAGTLLTEVGKAFIQGLLDGVNANTGIVDWFKELPGKILEWIGDVTGTLAEKGIQLIEGLWNGLQWAVGQVVNFFQELPGNILRWIGQVNTFLIDKGLDIIGGLWMGITQKFGEVLSWFSEIPGKISEVFTFAIGWLWDAGVDIAQGLWNGIRSIWGQIVDWVKRKVDDLIDTITHPWRIFSPSHLMRDLGQNIMKGWFLGLKDGFSDVDNYLSNLNATDLLNPDLDKDMGKGISKVLSSVVDKMSTIEDINPVITPVLDLTQVSKDAKKMSTIIQGTDTLVPTFSLNQARFIASSPDSRFEDPLATKPNVPPAGVSFEQNIYSPTQLSASDIYKQTRNQLTMAKEELSIP